MNDNRDEKLDLLLRERRFEAAGSDLAERIMTRARDIDQRPAASVGQRLRELFLEFHLPRPAYVIAGALLLGMIIGINAPLDLPSDNGESHLIQSFFYPDEDLL